MARSWQRPRTSRVYLQAPGARRVVLLQPEMKLVDLSLKMIGRHVRQDAFGLLLLDGGEALDHQKTRYTLFSPGVPVYSLTARARNGCRLTVTALASTDTVPVTIVRLEAENDRADACEGELGLLIRAARDADSYLTGLWDTGYESYQPNARQWLLMRSPRVRFDGLTATAAGCGQLKILTYSNMNISAVLREDQPKRFEPHDYFAARYRLAPGEKACLTLALSSREVPDGLSFEKALDDVSGFWRGLQARVPAVPKREEACFRHNVTQCLQMLSRYDGSDGLVVRQGDVGRYVWVWEGIHVLGALDRLGFSDYTSAAYRTYISWLKKDGPDRGRIDYPYVRWDNAEGALLLGLSLHVLLSNDPAEFAAFEEAMGLLTENIASRREKDGPFAGLYPPGVASDWGEKGYHWIYTDGLQVCALEKACEVFSRFASPLLPRTQDLVKEYRATLERVRDRLREGHEGDRTFIFPHIANLPFEDTFNHCFYTDGAILMLPFGLMDARSRTFEQMEAFYRENGLFEHGLTGRMTNATDPGVGAYGDTYYIGMCELVWCHAYLRRGETDRAKEVHRALMRYGVTSEYIVSERYCSFDPWYTPWQPNGSGSARLVWHLLDYWGEKEPKRQIL